MTEPGRPTIRCLTEDLGHDWGDVDQLRAISTGALRDLDIPLYELEHPVVRHLREVFDGSDSADVQREGISGLSNPMWYKLKTGRWRGAVYVDQEGKAWLCAAGLRKGGESSDFYKSFMEQVKNSGPAAFLPTDEDFDHARREKAATRLGQWERSLHRAAQAAFLEAARTGLPKPLTITSLRDGSVIAKALIEAIEVAEEGDSLTDVTIEFSDINWAATRYLDRAQEVLMLAICNEPTVWQPGHSSETQTFSLQSTDGLDSLVNGLQDDSVAGQPAEPRLSHYAKKELILGSAVNGDAVMSLCGVWLVQSRDAEALPKCPECAEIFRDLGN